MTGTNTAADGEIRISISALQDAQAQMASLAKELSNHKLTIQLDSSKGEFAQELLNIGAYLQSVGASFAQLAARCADVLTDAAAVSEEMDAQRISAIFASGNG